MSDTEINYKAGSKYILPRDEVELTRLNIQHEFMKLTVYEGRLIFDESVKLGPGSAVLDSGTETGAWITDLAKSVPSSVELYGSDVAADNFPHTYPANIHFIEASSTGLPEDWTGKFDVVNQCLLEGALLKEEWPVVLAEVLRVLKPGGHAQFAELDVPIMFVNGGPTCRRYLDLVETIFEKLGLKFDAAQRIAQALQDVGFTEIISEKKLGGIGASWGKIGKMGVTSILGAMKNSGPAVIKAGVMTEEEYAQLLASIEDDFEKVEGMQITYRMICARKPI